MLFGWIKAIVILPFNALVVLPVLAVWISGEKISIKDGWQLYLAILVFAIGFSLAIWTMILFHRIGKGTAAPWDPPKKLVVVGPYRHVRNPMLTSVFIMLIAEVLVTGSWTIAVFFVIFLTINMLYFPFVEEKELLCRFGEDYARYKANVPRYIPRFRPWINIDIN